MASRFGRPRSICLGALDRLPLARWVQALAARGRQSRSRGQCSQLNPAARPGSLDAAPMCQHWQSRSLRRRCGAGSWGVRDATRIAASAGGTYNRLAAQMSPTAGTGRSASGSLSADGAGSAIVRQARTRPDESPPAGSPVQPSSRPAARSQTPRRRSRSCR